MACAQLPDSLPGEPTPAVLCPLNSCQLAAVLVAMVIFENVSGCRLSSSLQARAFCGGPWVTRQTENRQRVRDPEALEPRLTLGLHWGLPGLRARNVGQVAKEWPWGPGRRTVSSSNWGQGAWVAWVS